MIKGAIFDMDGVLLDSMPYWETIGERYLISQHMQIKDGLREALFTMTMEEAAAYMKKEYHIPKTEETILDEFTELILQQYQTEIDVKPGVREFLESMKQRNIPMAIATSSDRSLVEAGLERHGLLPYFKQIVTCVEVGIGKKKSPLVYQKAMEAVGNNPEEVWVFEDSLHAIRTANKAGFCTIGLYDEGSSGMQEDIKREVAYYMGDMENPKVFWEHWKGQIV